MKLIKENTDKRFIILSILFFLMYAAFSSWRSFFNIYLKDIGFTGMQIGLIGGILPATMLFVVPVWGMFADVYGKRKVFLIAVSMTMFMLLGLGFIKDFGYYFFYMLLFSLFNNPNASLVDSLSLEHTISGNRKSEYGRMRMWGSVGWGVSSLLTGYYITNHDVGHIFYIAFGIFLMLILITIFGLKNDLGNDIDLKVNWPNFKRIITIKPLYIFLIILIFYGIAFSPLFLFINLFYHEIGATNSQIGLAFTVQAMSELPFFFYGKYFVKRFGAAKVLVFTMLLSCIRMLIYGFISSPEIAIIIGVSHGIILSLFLVSVIEYIHTLVPPQWKATGQSLLWGFFFGAGITLGNIWLGFLYDRITMQGAMIVESGLTFLLIIVMIVYFRVYDVWRRKE